MMMLDEQTIRLFKIRATSGARCSWYEFMKKLLACGLVGPCLDMSYPQPVVVEHAGRIC